MVFQQRIVDDIVERCVPPASADDVSLSFCAAMVGARLIHHDGFRYDPRVSGPDWVTVHHVRPDLVPFYYRGAAAVSSPAVRSEAVAAARVAGPTQAAAAAAAGGGGVAAAERQHASPPPPVKGILRLMMTPGGGGGTGSGVGEMPGDGSLPDPPPAAGKKAWRPRALTRLTWLLWGPNGGRSGVPPAAAPAARPAAFAASAAGGAAAAAAAAPAAAAATMTTNP